MAQENLSIKIKDENNVPIPFYTISNVKNDKLSYVADSLGAVKVQAIIGMTYHVHAVGFQDTLITLHDNNDLNITLKSGNQLKEIVIKPRLYATEAHVLRSSRANEFNWYASGNSTYNHEIGRVVSFEQSVWLQKVSFKIKTTYQYDFKKLIFVNIYRVGEKLQAQLDDLKKKKPGFYRLSSPDLVYSSHLDENYTVSFNNNFLSFDLSGQGIYLDPGNYVIVMELMAQTTIDVRPYYSLKNECLTIRSNNNAKVVTWFTDLWEGKYMNIITDITYFPKR
jgi:hypothetical protein